MAFILSADQQFTASVSYQDSQGNPSTVEGTPVWSSSDPNVLVVQAADDGMSATAAAGTIGTAQLSVTADADLGAGTQEVIGLLDVSVVAGQTVAAVISASEPSDKLVVQPVTP